MPLVGLGDRARGNRSVPAPEMGVPVKNDADAARVWRVVEVVYLHYQHSFNGHAVTVAPDWDRKPSRG